MQAYYHSIEHFGTVDGPGIRYVLFLAGCQLRCRFCHNPDTWQQGSQKITTEEILSDLLHYRHFYDSSRGGITASGGEPVLQSKFIVELFAACQSHKIHTVIDTAGYYDRQNITDILPYTNGALFSIKAVEPEKHRWLAGFDNQQIISNLHYMVQHIPVTLRYVVIPEITTPEKDTDALADLIHSLPAPVPVELLPYHSFGVTKWQALRMKYTLAHVPDATSQDVTVVADRLKSRGITII